MTIHRKHEIPMIANVSRRGMLKGIAATGSFVIAAQIPALAAPPFYPTGAEAMPNKTVSDPHRLARVWGADGPPAGARRVWGTDHPRRAPRKAAGRGGDRLCSRRIPVVPDLPGGPCHRLIARLPGADCA
jgi:hypothetical protein